MHRGYQVYRGTSNDKSRNGKRISEDAFQTWGNGIRFAVVPTAEGNQWYLATDREFSGHSDPLLSLKNRTIDPYKGTAKEVFHIPPLKRKFECMASESF